MTQKGSNQSEDTESVKTAKHRPQKQEKLSDPKDSLSTKKEQKPLPETVICNPDPNAVWLAGTEARSSTKAEDGLASGGEHHDIPDSKKGKDLENKNEDGEA